MHIQYILLIEPICINYAIQYAFNYNPAYGDFSTLGGDCTNFVSQIIRVCDY